MKKTYKKNFSYSAVNKFTANQVIKGWFNKGVFLMLLGLMLITKQGICQQLATAPKNSLGLAVSGIVNADGYGTQYLPTVYYKRNRSYFFAGPVIQKKKMNFSGLQLNYEYNLIKEGDTYSSRVELFCFATGIYQHNAILGKQALHNESLANPEYTENMCELHFKTVEAYGGFGLRIKLFKNVKWTNSIGAGGYSCFNFPQHLYYTNHNVGLFFKTGISIDLKIN